MSGYSAEQRAQLHDGYLAAEDPMTALPLEPHTEAEEATLARFEAAEPAPESWERRPPLLRLMDVLGVTPHIKRIVVWLSRHLPGGAQ